MWGTVYACTDGRYYGCTQLWERFESGTWTPCCWNAESGQEWVYTATGDLLCLTPVPPMAVPDRFEIERCEEGLRVTERPTVRVSP
ncbi:hypothetical protein ACLI4Y_17455 [Natrialbaceae archaeon A-CW3]